MAGMELPGKTNRRKKCGHIEKSDRSGRLAIILTDMLNSALAWEQTHSQPPHDGVAFKKRE